MSEHRYWFRAKRYGWGWGLPLTWEGWVVLVGYLALLPAGAWIFGRHTIGFFAYVVLLSIVLFAICYSKGEPPKWRWGRRA